VLYEGDIAAEVDVIMERVCRNGVLNGVEEPRSVV
jgi:hypothetical protein